MSNLDSALVDKIVARVMSALDSQLDSQGLAQAPPQAKAVSDGCCGGACVTCTGCGDCKSKADPQAGSSRATAKAPVGKIPKRIFVTAEMLGQRLGKADGSQVVLAANEYLTPAATDLVAKMNLSISRSLVSTGATKPAQPQKPKLTVPSIPPATAAVGTGPVGLVVETPGDKTQSVLSALAHDGVTFIDRTGQDCWATNVVNLCGEIATGQLTAGVVVMKYAAEAMVLANKIPGIRACQGTCVASVSAALRRIGANVLILETAQSTFHELRAMTKAFASQRAVTAINVDVVNKIKSIERA